MNLPYPFNKAKDVKANLDGAISLVDAQGKALARLPLITAFDLSPEAEGFGYGVGFGFGFGYGVGYGVGFGSGSGSGYGYGYGSGSGDGSGGSK